MTKCNEFLKRKKHLFPKVNSQFSLKYSLPTLDESTNESFVLPASLKPNPFL